MTAFSDSCGFHASDADRMAAGTPPENTFNPPGYPVRLLLASPLTSDRFTAGKWISLLAGGLFLLFMSLTSWERRDHLFFGLACYSGLAALALLEVARGIGRVFDSSVARHVAATTLILWIAVPPLYVVRLDGR